MSRGGALRGTGGRGRPPPGLAVRGAPPRRRRPRRARPSGVGLAGSSGVADDADPPAREGLARAAELEEPARGAARARARASRARQRWRRGRRAGRRRELGPRRRRRPGQLARPGAAAFAARRRSALDDGLDATGRSRFDSTTIDGAPLVPMAQIGAPMIIVGWRAAADETGARDGGRTLPVPAPERLGSPSKPKKTARHHGEGAS
ncbi:hypothetical protein SO694_00023157 [Aureococcus anophagefferens]|uniref:Uncharacterized protein n=1 Tax=Aureococcus anophagefferens TaxID=44056 RepID=A0ABR1FTI6_AURAN